MAKKDPSFDAQRKQEELEAKKKLKAAEKAKPEKEKDKKAAGKKKSKKALRWLRDFRGETKKIVWPDAKTVLKSTGIVIMAVLIIGSMVWIVDWVLSNSILFAKNVAAGSNATEQVTEPENNAMLDLFEDYLGGNAQDGNNDDDDNHDGHDH